ncbi:MAG: acyl-CoA thioesterase [Pusillimonas sp.]
MPHKFVNKLSGKVYYSDTDAYGVVWHGSYLRWFEMGRVEYLQELGANLKDLAEQNDIIMPVVEINLRYKSSAVINDPITIETEILKVERASITFSQIIRNALTDKINVLATVTAVTTNSKGKLYRKLPCPICDIFSSTNASLQIS